MRGRPGDFVAHRAPPKWHWEQDSRLPSNLSPAEAWVFPYFLICSVRQNNLDPQDWGMGEMTSKNSQKHARETLNDCTRSARGRPFWGFCQELSHSPPQAQARARPCACLAQGRKPVMRKVGDRSTEELEDIVRRARPELRDPQGISVGRAVRAHTVQTSAQCRSFPLGHPQLEFL